MYALYGAGLPFGLLPLELGSMETGYAFNMLFVSVLTVIVFKLAAKNWRFGFQKEGFLAGIGFYSVGVWGGIAGMLAAFYMQYAPLRFNADLLQVYGFFTVNYLLVGLVEEIGMRGVIVNALMKYFGDDKRGLLYSVLISSGIFSLTHIVGWTGAGGILVMKLIWTLFMGISFALIYHAAKNLIAVILMHGIVDILLPLPKLLSSNIASGDIAARLQSAVSSFDALVQVIGTGLICLITVAITANKKKKTSGI
jgi:membrane protease YdiL (CAAX protease family)